MREEGRQAILLLSFVLGGILCIVIGVLWWVLDSQHDKSALPSMRSGRQTSLGQPAGARLSGFSLEEPNPDLHPGRQPATSLSEMGLLLHKRPVGKGDVIQRVIASWYWLIYRDDIQKVMN